jgi:hypothetical protein
MGVTFSVPRTVAGFYCKKVDGDVDSVGGEPPEAGGGGAPPQVPEPLRLQLPHQGPQQQKLFTIKNYEQTSMCSDFKRSV